MDKYTCVVKFSLVAHHDTVMFAAFVSVVHVSVHDIVDACSVHFFVIRTCTLHLKSYYFITPSMVTGWQLWSIFATIIIFIDRTMKQAWMDDGVVIDGFSDLSVAGRMEWLIEGCMKKRILQTDLLLNRRKIHRQMEEGKVLLEDLY